MPTVHKQPKANEDLFDIWSFIAADSADAADAWIDKLDKKFALIATQPFMGKSRAELCDGMRSFPFGRYMIFYMPVQSGINVVRVLHSARDIEPAMDWH